MVWNHGLVLSVLILYAHIALVYDLLGNVLLKALEVFSKCLNDLVVSILMVPLFSVKIFNFVMPIINTFVDISHVSIVNAFIFYQGAIELPC